VVLNELLLVRCELHWVTGPLGASRGGAITGWAHLYYSVLSMYCSTGQLLFAACQHAHAGNRLHAISRFALATADCWQGSW